MSDCSKPKKRRRQILTILGISLILGLLISTAKIILAPKIYESTVVISLKEELPWSESIEEGSEGETDLDLFPEVVLTELAERTEWAHEWELPLDFVKTILRGQLRVESIEENELIKIVAKDPDWYFVKVLAAEYPDALAEAMQAEVRKELNERVDRMSIKATGKIDLIEEHLFEVRGLLTWFGARKLKAEDVTKEEFLAFYASLPVTERERRGGEKDNLLTELMELEIERKELALVNTEKEEWSAKLAGLESPVVVNERASEPVKVRTMRVTEDLAFGLGQGVVLGGCLIGLAYFFLWRNEDDEEEEMWDLPVPSDPDPNDPW